MQYRAVTTEEQLSEVVAAYSQFNAFSFDVETRGTRQSRWKKGSKADRPALDPMTNEVFWIGLAGPGRSDAIPLGHPDGPKQLFKRQVFDALEPLFFSDRLKINHNIKFDLLSVAKYYDGKIPSEPYGETLVLTSLLNENLSSYKLGDLVARYLHFTYEKLGEHIDQATFQEACLYSHLDAKMVWLLYHHLYPRLVKAGLVRLYEMEMDLLGVLCRMQQTGAYVDQPGFVALGKDLSERIAIAQEQVFELGGKRFLLTSAPQKAEFVYDHLKLKCSAVTDKGARKTDIAALTPLAPKHKAVAAMLEHSAMRTLHSTFIDGYMHYIDDDGRIRSSLKQTGAKTGRFSSAEPNLQNVPARDRVESAQIRSLFIAPEGRLLVVGDYSQVELRILAHYCKDPNLRRAFLRGLDLHAFTASLIYGVPLDSVTKEQRMIGKTLNFAIVYGAGPLKIVQTAGVGQREAKRLLDSLFKAYPNIKLWTEATVESCRKNGYTKTILGRKRRLPEIHHPDYKWRGYAERQAVNHVIQGSAAEFMKMALIRFQRRIDRQTWGDYIHPILTVHDELVAEVDEEYVPEAEAMMRQAMEKVHWEDGSPMLTVPLVADIHSGKSWADAK